MVEIARPYDYCFCYIMDKVVFGPVPIMDIFISCSKKDKDIAYKIADDLTSAGFEIWIDRSLEVGDEWETFFSRQGIFTIQF